jgi:hypothetical protein
MTKSILPYKLPRKLESDSEAEGLMELLFSRTRKLCENNTFAAPVIKWTDAFKKSLLVARRAGHAVRGFDNASELLEREMQGIIKLKKQDGQGERISRLVLMSNDGANNFYNKVDRLLVKHSPRVLGCVVEVDSYMLGSLLFGQEKISKLVLIDHKDAVSGILLSTKSEK